MKRLTEIKSRLRGRSYMLVAMTAALAAGGSFAPFHAGAALRMMAESVGHASAQDNRSGMASFDAPSTRPNWLHSISGWRYKV
jgi:hypothetical protein